MIRAAIGAISSSGQSFPTVLYPTIDRAIKAGTGNTGGALGYWSFGDLFGAYKIGSITVYRLCVPIRLGSNHNGAADGRIHLLVSDDKFATAGTNIEIKGDDVGNNVTNPTGFVDPVTKRAFVFWTRLSGAVGAMLSGPGDYFFKYSDNLFSVADPATATWSAETRMTTDYGLLESTSTTSINLSTVTVSSIITPTIGTGLTGVVLGRIINLASRSDFNKYVRGTITAYNPGTGATSITVTQKNGTTTHIDWDASLTTYIDGPGAPIQISDTEWWKPLWTVTAGTGQDVHMYRTLDAGLTWTYHSTIPHDALHPSDETTIVKLPDGTIRAFVRNNDLLLTRISDWNGSSWSTLVTSDLPGGGKVPMALSPAGMLSGIGRNLPTNSKTFFFYSVAPYTSYTHALIDNRSNYMYGGYIWYPPDEEFLCVYSVESENTVFATGPTLLIMKSLKPSLTPIAPPTTYDIDYQNVLDFTQGNYENIPANALKTEHSGRVATLRSSGALALHEDYFVRVHADASLEQFARRSWKFPWKQITIVGSPTYGVDGWALNGTTQYLILPVTFSQYTQYLQNSAMFFNFNLSEIVSIGAEGWNSQGSFSTFNQGVGLFTKYTDNLCYYAINQSTYDNFSNLVDRGLYMGQRNGASGTFVHPVSGTIGVSTMHKNGVLAKDATTASGARPTAPAASSAIHFASSFNQLSTRKKLCEGFGAPVPGLELIIYNIWNGYATYLGL